MMFGKWFSKKLSKRIPFFVTLLCFTFLLLAAVPKHDYHVSVTQMQYNPAQKSFEISIRIFTDDLEKALSQSNAKQRFTLKNDDKNAPIVEQYIRKSFILTDNQKKTPSIHFLGKEQEEDATWVYLEVPFNGMLNGWQLQNSTLMEVFDDQVNMTNIKLTSEKKTILFKKGQSIQSL